MELRDPRYKPDLGVVGKLSELYRMLLTSGSRTDTFLAAQSALDSLRIDFIENMFWILNKDMELQLLILKPAQLRLMEVIARLEAQKKACLIAILKARQGGHSTGVAAYNMTKILTRRHVRAQVLAHTDRTAGNLFAMYTRFYDNLPEDIRPSQGVGSRHGKRLILNEQEARRTARGGLDSEISVMVPREAGSDGVGSIGRGLTANYLHVSEIAHWSNPEASMAALMSSHTRRPDTAVILETTAARAEDYFHKFWRKALSGENDYVGFFVPWFEEPDYAIPFRSDAERDKFEASLNQAPEDPYGDECDLQERFELSLEQLHWRRDCIRNTVGGDLVVFMREYPATAEEAFQSAEGNFISPTVISGYLAQACPPMATGILSHTGPVSLPKLAVAAPRKSLVRIWESPVGFAEYVIGVDVSENLPSGDFTAGVVLRRLPEQVVAVFRALPKGVIPTAEECAEQLALLGRYYNNAWVAVEMNAIGKELIYILREVERYPKLVIEQMISPDIKRDTPIYGIRTHTLNRKVMMEHLKAFYEVTGGEVWDDIMIRECGALILNERGKAIAPNKGVRRPRSMPEPGYYDDLAMSLGIACLVNDRLPAPKTVREQEEAVYERFRAGANRAFNRADDPTGAMNYV